MPTYWNQKQLDFYSAMKKYEEKVFYKRFTLLLAFINTFGTLLFLIKTCTLQLSWYNYLIITVIAFFSADFINGIVHLVMDNLDNYKSNMGPFIANFHLHHDKPMYTYKNIWQVYFYESGHKIWLTVLLFTTSILVLNNLKNNNEIITFIAFFSLFSCLAEVSHFLCHNSKNKFVLTLQKYHLLLPKAHHLKHHQQDNTHYAFLNGSSDILINAIAKALFKGYKMNTDKHIELYNYKKKLKQNSF